MAERVSDALEQGNQKRKWKRHCWSTVPIVVFVVYRHAFSENKTRMVCWTSNFAAFISRVRVANATKRSRQDVLAVCCIWLPHNFEMQSFLKEGLLHSKKDKGENLKNTRCAHRDWDSQSQFCRTFNNKRKTRLQAGWRHIGSMVIEIKCSDCRQTPNHFCNNEMEREILLSSSLTTASKRVGRTEGPPILGNAWTVRLGRLETPMEIKRKDNYLRERTR